MINVDRYLILVEGGPASNYSAWSPDVLGCVAVGDTIDECVANMRGALLAHLELLSEEGSLPDATGPGVYVEHSAASAA